MIHMSILPHLKYITSQDIYIYKYVSFILLDAKQKKKREDLLNNFYKISY